MPILPTRPSRRAILLAPGAVALAWSGAARAEPIPVTVTNKTVPTLCAEDDNVYLTLENPKVGGFRLEARPPAVIGTILVDQTAPDFTDCVIKDQPPDPKTLEDTRIVLHEDDTSMLVGYRHADFWRDGNVALQVGARKETGLHLVQLFAKSPTREPYEYLVLYPQDGYWRARPLPPERLPSVAYGTSFLVGPIEEKQRPFVTLKDIVYDPKTRAFDFAFDKGGKGRLRVAQVAERGTVVDITLEPGITGRPFAALRSMFITEVNADAARIDWREAGSAGWKTQSVTDFRKAAAHEVWLGRYAVSRHNSSAPDTLIRAFRGIGPGP
jgi:hypothetical protein